MSGVTGGVMETEKSHFNRAIPRAQVVLVVDVDVIVNGVNPVLTVESPR